MARPPLPGSAERLGFAREVAARPRLERDEARMALAHDFHHHLGRYVGIRAVLAHIFHVTASLTVVGMEDRVLAPVELERLDVELLAERQVEGGGRLEPAPAEPELGDAMVEEDAVVDEC